MDPYQGQGQGNSQLDRQLAMSILMSGNASASEAVKLTRVHQQAAAEQQGTSPQQTPQGGALLSPGLSPAVYSPDMIRLQRDLLNREIAARTGAFPPLPGGPESLLRVAALNAPQHPPYSSLLSQQVHGHSSSLGLPPMASVAAAAAAVRRNSPPLSPSLKPDPEPATGSQGAGALGAVNNAAAFHHSLKRAAAHHRDSLGGSSHGSNEASAHHHGKRARHMAPPAVIGGNHLRMLSGAPPVQHQQPLPRGSKAKLRDDFWGKVGKNNSHIHLVNIVLGRLLFEQVKNSRGGNKVLSNDLIQQILEHKLYGKYEVKDFFASANKASETVRNTWTRLNFASDNIRKGLSRYKEQTWQAIERCGFEEVKEDDKREMDEALKVFVSTGRFVAALDVALRGIITEPFMGVLMQLRLEWNGLCLNCRPEDHDSIVSAFLRKYGLNGK